MIIIFTACSEDKVAKVYGFSAMPTALKVAMDEYSKDISITSHTSGQVVEYDVIRFPSWTNVIKRDGGITISFSENDLNELRSGEVLLRQNVSGDSLVIPVAQSAVVFADSASNAEIPDNSQLLIEKDFLSTGSGSSEVANRQIGFASGNATCGTSLISDTEAFDYMETYFYNPVVRDTILIHYHDVGINPLCSTGAHVLFNKRATISRIADPYLLTDELAAVSVVQFNIGASQLVGRGLALYASVSGADFKPVGIFMPSEVDKIETYTLAVNLSNVRLKFAPLGKSGYMRLYGLKVYSAQFIHDGSLVIDENFQNWKREGFLEMDPNSTDCDVLMSTTNIMYAQTPYNSSKAYPKWTVNWSFFDYAINPTCGNDAGTSTASSDISIGYFAMQAPLYYECGLHMSNGHIATSALPSVSKVRFSISYTKTGTNYVNGVVLWKKGKKDTQWMKVGAYSIDGTFDDKIKGQVFEADVNEEDVELRFSPRFPFLNGVDITPDHAANLIDISHPDIANLIMRNFANEQINRAVRLHDLKVWCLKK
jgi:hypothetical protein